MLAEFVVPHDARNRVAQMRRQIFTLFISRPLLHNPKDFPRNDSNINEQPEKINGE